jgi:hypothetical protein
LERKRTIKKKTIWRINIRKGKEIWEKGGKKIKVRKV